MPDLPDLPDLLVRPLRPDDDIRGLLVEAWGGTEMVVHGRRFDLLALPTLVALDGPRLVGVLTYELRGSELEVVSCDSLVRRRGVGRALVAAVLPVAVDAGARDIVCTTTNDNLADGLRRRARGRHRAVRAAPLGGERPGGRRRPVAGGAG